MSEWREFQQEQAARRIERRSFLKGAAALSTLAMLETNKIARALVPSFGPPDASKVGPIVVTMMENRTLDHYLGWMGPAIDGIQHQVFPSTLVDGGGNPIGGGCTTSSSSHQFAGAGPSVSTYHLDTHCLASDPDHGWTGSRNEFNGGAMNGWHHQSGIDSLGYYNREDVPMLGWMAENYTTFSRYFSSVMGPTYPNRIYWLAGQGGGFKGNTLPLPDAADREPDGHDWACIFHQLDQAGIPWTYYHHDLATVMLFFNRVEENPGRVRFIADYFADAAAGVLTPVVFLDPSFVVIGNDDHPARDVMFGQRYIYDTFMALAEGPQWWDGQRGAVYCVTYDEGGGFYDHVPPPRAAGDPNGSADHCEDWARLGFRVPTVVASPFSRGPDNGGPTGLVNQNLMDHTSILKFIQWRFGLGSLNDFTYNGGRLPFANGAKLGSRDNDPSIHNLNEVLDFANPRPEFPSEPPNIPLHLAQGLYCSPSQLPEHSGGHNELEHAPDVNAPPLARPRLPQPPAASAKAIVPHADWIELADKGFFGKFDFRERAARNSVFRD